MNVIGNVYNTLTGSPCKIAGLKSGSNLQTRMASSSRSLSTDSTTAISPILPSLFTMNCTTTRPSTLLLAAQSGYRTFCLRKSNKASSPPGNSGIFSGISQFLPDSSLFNLNVRGTLNHLSTALPLMLAGMNLGSVLMTRIASRSRDSSTERKICTSPTFPIVSIKKRTTTFPSMFFSAASGGYWRLSAKYLIKAASPPGKRGGISGSM